MTKHAGLHIRQVGRNCQRCHETVGTDMTFGARDWYQAQQLSDNELSGSWVVPLPGSAAESPWGYLVLLQSGIPS